jgi:hypothetical protein
MRRESDYFGDSELDLVYIAKKLKEALALEDLLTAHGYSYLVEPDTYRGGFIFASERIGAFFYVDPANTEAVRSLMLQNRYKPYAGDR